MKDLSARPTTCTLFVGICYNGKVKTETVATLDVLTPVDASTVFRLILGCARVAIRSKLLLQTQDN